jgi:small subunit ribosomal protein S18
MDNYDDSDDDRGRGRGNGSGGGEGDPFGLRRRRGGRKRAPAFTLEKDFAFDYKNSQQLRFFLTDRGKVVPRRISGLSAKQQRQLTLAIKRARQIALLPFSSNE